MEAHSRASFSPSDYLTPGPARPTSLLYESLLPARMHTCMHGPTQHPPGAWHTFVSFSDASVWNIAQYVFCRWQSSRLSRLVVATFRRNILLLRPWRWKQYVPPKRWQPPTSPLGFTTSTFSLPWEPQNLRTHLMLNQDWLNGHGDPGSIPGRGNDYFHTTYRPTLQPTHPVKWLLKGSLSLGSSGWSYLLSWLKIRGTIRSPHLPPLASSWRCAQLNTEATLSHYVLLFFNCTNYITWNKLQ